MDSGGDLTLVFFCYKKVLNCPGDNSSVEAVINSEVHIISISTGNIDDFIYIFILFLS